jgi:ferredoxin-type protein NapH
MKKWLNKKRLTIQTGSFVLLNTAFWGSGFKWICNPVLNCHGCPLAWFACPIGVFIHYSGYQIFPFFALGVVLLIGALVGRLLCGWVCPFGWLQDLLHRIPSPKFSMPKWTNAIKYVVLVAMVFAIPWFLGPTTAWAFCRICPTAALQVTLPAFLGLNPAFPGTTLAMDASMILKLGLAALILALAVFSSRSFCRVLCPIGALLAPLNHLSPWTVKFKGKTCTACTICDKVCPTDVQPMDRLRQDIPANRSLDCVVCHDCTKRCPSFTRKKKQAKTVAATK